MSFSIFDDDFDFFGSQEDKEEAEATTNKPVLKRPPGNIKTPAHEPEPEYRCVVCGALAKSKCEYCLDRLCGQYHCMVSHNTIKSHLKRFMF
jgi:hypothetical protein